MFFPAVRISLFFAVSIFLIFLILVSNIRGSLILSKHPIMIAYADENDNKPKFKLTHGIASGDVTNDSAIIWSRNNQGALMHVTYDSNANFTHPKMANTTKLSNQTTDYTSHIKLEGLSPDTDYYYRVWFSAPSLSQNTNDSLMSNTLTGSFRTAPDRSSVIIKPIIFIFA